MKKQLFCFVLFLSAFTLFAQPAIKFDSTTIDFGTIKEDDGKSSGRFEFTNTGNQDLLLTGVKPGCGCTAADYTKTPIAPGGRGFIVATYNPYNRPGPFNKSIRVTTNESENENASAHTIYIKGNVEKKPPSRYELEGYKTGTGEIRIQDNQVKLEMLNTDAKTFTIRAKNFSDVESTFEPTNMPNYIIMEQNVTSIVLRAGEERDVTFKYDAVKKEEIGSFKDIITIQTQDPTEPRITIFIEVVISEDFSKLTPKQLQDSPKAVLDSLTLDFGKVEKNTSPTLQIKLYNKGKNPLKIRQLKSSNPVFAITTDKTEITKDGFATFSITFNAKNRRGVQNTIIEIITNDPANTKMLLNCKGEILQ